MSLKGPTCSLDNVPTRSKGINWEHWEDWGNDGGDGLNPSRNSTASVGKQELAWNQPPPWSRNYKPTSSSPKHSFEDFLSAQPSWT
jgi:hypothetical protein